MANVQKPKDPFIVLRNATKVLAVLISFEKASLGRTPALTPTSRIRGSGKPGRERGLDGKESLGKRGGGRVVDLGSASCHLEEPSFF